MNRQPSCVVLGGGGFIGTNLCRRLLASGHRVRAFGRQCRFPDDLRGIEWCEGDFTDQDAVAAAIASFDIVFHLVHSTMPQAANLSVADDVQNNVVPTVTLLELCRKFGVSRIIFASSGGTLYGLAGEIPTPETAPAEPICAYGISKLAIEKYLALYEHYHSLDFRVLRIANPYGPFQIAWKGQGFVAAAVARALSGHPIEVWGDGSIVRDFVFIDDVIDAFEAVLKDTGNNRIYNVGTGEGRNLRQVLAAIGHLLGIEIAVTWGPSRPLDVPISIVDRERARTALGWRPKTSFEAGLALTIDWARHHRAEIDRLFDNAT